MFTAQPGDIVLLDLAMRLELHLSAANCVFLTIPRLALQPLDDDHGCSYTMHVGGGSAVAGLLHEQISSLVRHIPRLSSQALSWLVPGTLALIAGSVKAAVGAADAADRQALSPLVRRIQQYVEANLAAGSLMPAVVCERFGVSRSRLHRLFEANGGFTRYVQSRRLTRCMQTMATDPQRNIADIA